MISQRCPRCHSNRIRRGYRPTRFWSKVLFRYNLLCNACNWEFRGFAVPGTVSAKPARRRKNQTKTDEPQNLETDVKEETLENQAEEEQTDIAEKAVSSNKIRVRKKVRIRQS